MKNIWEKPKLIVLVRGKPEECVLNGCKTSTIDGDPDNYYFSCLDTGCSLCQAVFGT